MTAAVDFFRRAGVVLVEDMDELVETRALMIESTRKPAGDGLAVINVSGGEVALTCDLAQAAGLRFPALGEATLEALRACLPPFAMPRNPLDETGTAAFDNGDVCASGRVRDSAKNKSLRASAAASQARDFSARLPRLRQG